MKQNIRFHYLYRDSGNYKKFGFKVFSNPTNLSIEEIQIELSNKLIDGIYFYPEKVGIQKFRFHRYCDDYSWYEMENLELINFGKPKETIQNFLERFYIPNYTFNLSIPVTKSTVFLLPPFVSNNVVPKSDIRQYENKQIYLPASEKFYPSVYSLHEHRKRFGFN